MPKINITNLSTLNAPLKESCEDWERLARLSEEDLSQRDIADVHLSCAMGLPEAKGVNKQVCLKRIDEWAATVKKWTKHALPEFYNTNRKKFRNSVAFFRAVAMVTALQRHCGVRYDKSQIGLGRNDPFKFESQFIHGVINGRGGTCATLPVIYAAVGRRLGYPIRLVAAKRHLFCRWDDTANGERFNMEGAGDGFDSLPDNEYRRWPELMTPVEEKKFGYLHSMSAREELAGFVAERAFIHEDNQRYANAVETLVVAADLTPHHSRYSSVLMGTLVAWQNHLVKITPREFPIFNFHFKPDYRKWPSIPWEVESAYAKMLVHEDYLANPTNIARWWQPLREGRSVSIPRVVDIGDLRY